ncbi:regulator of G-protein signaling 20 [Suncus etruscus]|uniref:regulator of G-protein signaling 20 n=1 Tax=Suncus etruscus TaxID=109475 RepID=UPI00211000C3|nr:regulator of G-protein signaling 20 [Suncus etruscus]
MCVVERGTARRIPHPKPKPARTPSWHVRPPSPFSKPQRAAPHPAAGSAQPLAAGVGGPPNPGARTRPGRVPPTPRSQEACPALALVPGGSGWDEEREETEVERGIEKEETVGDPARPSGAHRGRLEAGRTSCALDTRAGAATPASRAIPLEGSEPTEAGKQQMSAAREKADSTPGQQGVASNQGSNTCCFCWCCCCSCSCLTVRNPAEQTPSRASQVSVEEKPACEESSSPTLEEVRAWGQSFDQLMVTPAGRNAFREFLRTEFSEENMLFWMACEELKQEANGSTVEEKARTIYDDYISILSPKEVSLDSRVREVINRDMLAPSQHVFDDAQLQIYTLMHRDSYPRFTSSALYKDLLRALSEKAVEA